MIRDAFAEALRRDPEKTRRWVVRVDGKPKQLGAVKGRGATRGRQGQDRGAQGCPCRCRARCRPNGLVVLALQPRAMQIGLSAYFEGYAVRCGLPAEPRPGRSRPDEWLVSTKRARVCYS
ncbi:MAG: hypothetical protein BGO98_32600 [Myxococcales bacterium 68-20]|nr:MAG: hypothetical protein BGO98_32600 [Myxococcales bacterium 68-20]